MASVRCGNTWSENVVIFSKQAHTHTLHSFRQLRVWNCVCVCLRVLPQPSLRHCPFHTFFNISPEPNNFPQPEYVLPAASRDANARVYRYHGKMVHSPLCGQPLPGPERTAAGLPRFQGYEGVPKSRENGTPWQGRVHSPVSEQPISNRKAISVQLRYCLWGKVPQIRDKAVHFPGFGTASVGLTGHIDTAAALSYGESVPILGDCGTLSGSADWRTCLCSVLTVPRDCGRGKSVRNQRQICSLSRGDRDARVRADAICLRQDEYYNRYH